MTVPYLNRHPDCVFCRILNGDEPARVLYYGAFTVTIVPLNPVTPGHALVIPYTHVSDSSDDPHVTGATFADAARYAAANVGNHNLITSTGPAATQTIQHLHVHVVPRTEGDGLTLPWTKPQPAVTVTYDEKPPVPEVFLYQCRHCGWAATSAELPTRINCPRCGSPINPRGTL